MPPGTNIVAIMVISCLVLLVIFPRIFADNCDNIVRLVDLQEIIKNQTKLIRDQSQIVENQKKIIRKQSKLIGDLKKTGIFFTVGLTQQKTFVKDEIIKFDRIITNVGSGYIDDSNNTDYGKFIAPQNGTYQFTASFYNVNMVVGGDLQKNGIFVTGANNGGSGAASLSAMLDLEEGGEVHLQNPGWIPSNAEYHKYFTSFSGALLHVEV